MNEIKTEKLSPNPIKEYYIAYIDILGYKAFFKDHSSEIFELLFKIDEAINRTVVHINSINMSPIFTNMGSIDIKTKIFSDNILLCMETLDNPIESLRALVFIQVVSDIQRGFVTEYGLFLRGGITKGYLSVNENYVFGQGLIDAVEMEEKIALYPRIITDETIVNDVLENKKYQDQDNLNLKELMNGYIQYAIHNLIWKWDDEVYFLNYLQIIDAGKMFGKTVVESVKGQLQKISPIDYNSINKQFSDQDQYLMISKNRIEEKLKVYGRVHENDILGKEKALKEELQREYVLKKYIWVMAYHNRFCLLNNKMEYFINTECNCDTRYLKMMIKVIENKAEEQ